MAKELDAFGRVEEIEIGELAAIAASRSMRRSPSPLRALFAFISR
jgi:hypothetical protein